MAEKDVITNIIHKLNRIQILFKSLDLFVIINVRRLLKKTSYYIFDLKEMKHYEGNSSHIIDLSNEEIDEYWKKMNIVKENKIIHEIKISNSIEEVIKMTEYMESDFDGLEFNFSDVYFMMKNQNN